MGAAFNIALFASLLALWVSLVILEKTITRRQRGRMFYGLAGLMLIAIAPITHGHCLTYDPIVAAKQPMKFYQTGAGKLSSILQRNPAFGSILFILLFRAEGQIQTIGPLFPKRGTPVVVLVWTMQIGSLYGVIGSLSFIADRFYRRFFTANSRSKSPHLGLWS